MAKIVIKYRENVPGKYFVDSRCIDCDMCRQTAPANFKRKYNGADGFTYVGVQPRNAYEERLSAEAMTSCPVKAIGTNVIDHDYDVTSEPVGISSMVAMMG